MRRHDEGAILHFSFILLFAHWWALKHHFQRAQTRIQLNWVFFRVLYVQWHFCTLTHKISTYSLSLGHSSVSSLSLNFFFSSSFGSVCAIHILQDGQRLTDTDQTTGFSGLFDGEFSPLVPCAVLLFKLLTSLSAQLANAGPDVWLLLLLLVWFRPFILWFVIVCVRWMRIWMLLSPRFNRRI